MDNETLLELKHQRNRLLNEIRRERYREDEAFREKTRERARRSYYRRKERGKDSQENT